MRGYKTALRDGNYSTKETRKKKISSFTFAIIWDKRIEKIFPCFAESHIPNTVKILKWGVLRN